MSKRIIYNYIKCDAAQPQLIIIIYFYRTIVYYRLNKFIFIYRKDD